MDTETLKSEIRTLIGKSKTEAAIKLLSEQPLGRLDREAVILQGQYARVKEELQLDVVSREEAERKINQINLAILDLAERVSQPARTPLSNTQGRQWLWLLLIPALLAIGYAVYPKSEADETQNEAGMPNEQVDAGESHQPIQPAQETEGASGVKETQVPADNPKEKENPKEASPAAPEMIKLKFVLDRMEVIKDGDNDGSDGDFYWDILLDGKSIEKKPENDDIQLSDRDVHSFNTSTIIDYTPGQPKIINLLAKISENDSGFNGGDDHIVILKPIVLQQYNFKDQKVVNFDQTGTHEDGSPKVKLYWRLEVVNDQAQ